MNAADALAELKELSTQIETIVVASRDGSVEAASIDAASATSMAGAALRLVEGADQMRQDMGRQGVAQLEAATPDGCVFVVLDERRMAVATTGADPTVGLVLYDLKTLLRQVGPDDAGGDEAADG
ncbi:MAG: hypothetical protein ACXVYV_04455 [Gaiellales bacterium]